MNSVSVTFPRLIANGSAVDPGNWDQPGPAVTTPGTNVYDSIFVFPGLGYNAPLMWAETIDMSAFVVQDKTFFPGDIRVSEPGLLTCGPTAAEWNNEAATQVLDLISNVPLTLADVINPFYRDGTFPGTPDSTIDMQFIVYGRYQAFSNNVSSSYPGAMNLIKSATFGAGLPTASDKLYCLRIVLPGSGAGNPTGLAELNVPDTIYEIVGVAAEEDELSRIYRLRQSYEQKQG